MNHTCFPKKDHLPDWARPDNKVTKNDRVELSPPHNTEQLDKNYTYVSKQDHTWPTLECIPLTLSMLPFISLLQFFLQENTVYIFEK